MLLLNHLYKETLWNLFGIMFTFALKKNRTAHHRVLRKERRIYSRHYEGIWPKKIYRTRFMLQRAVVWESVKKAPIWWFIRREFGIRN